MIIYGWGSAHLKTGQARHAVCPSCGEKGTVIISIFSKHFHIFWIPLFPYAKSVAAQCQHCNHSMDKHNMSDEIKLESDELKSETRPRFWQFIGTGIIAVLIILGVNSSQNETKREIDYLLSPMVGDVIEFKTESGNYSTFKLTEVTADSVLYIINDYEVNQRSGISDIAYDSSYSDDLYIMPIGELMNMYNDETIYDVNRE